MNPAVINSGDTAWVLFCAAAVLFMTPGLALFYAGMVSRRNTLVMLQQNFIPLGLISLTWVLVGYSLAFGAGGPFVGGLGKAFFAGVEEGTVSGTITAAVDPTTAGP